LKPGKKPFSKSEGGMDLGRRKPSPDTGRGLTEEEGGEMEEREKIEKRGF